MLGWKPNEYYLATPYEFFCACEGYFIKLEHQASLHRLSSFRIHQSLVQKPLKIKDYWPIWGDQDEAKKAGNGALSKDEWDEILKTHNVKLN